MPQRLHLLQDQACARRSWQLPRGGYCRAHSHRRSRSVDTVRGSRSSRVPVRSTQNMLAGHIISCCAEEGVVEIWLTSEDTGAYGRDIGTDLPTLLWKIVEVLPEGCMLRLGMTNPPYILEHIEEMAKIMNHPRVYAFLHIPIQSASDSVLERMKREYTQAEFCRVVDYFKEHVPGVTIATDIIAGFPGETDEEFEETVDLVRRYKFPVLFTNQFYPRPGTPAAAMKRIFPPIVKNRTRELSALFRSYFPYAHKVGERQRVLVTEIASDKKHYVAHNKFYEQVLVDMRPEIMGKLIDVEIVRTGKFFQEGRIIESSIASAPVRPAPLKQGEVSRHQRSSNRQQRASQLPTWQQVLSNNKLAVAIVVVLLLLELLRFLLR
eukprot:m.105724 g.105724  ORF g.105724 m.105724 type:complete len:379 (-) comp9157_c0_seq1:169-1305(-)